MDIVSFLSSLNKIGLVAFLITLGFLIYEIMLLNKASRAKEKPQVPKFQEGGQILPSTQVSIEGEDQNAAKKNKFVLLLLIVLLLFFGTITLFGYFNLRSTKEKNKQALPSEKVSKTVSKKIKAVVPALSPTEIPTPTREITNLAPSLSPTPTEMPLTTEPSPSPTVIEELPVTGYISNSLILLSVAGLVVLFSFLF